MKRVVTASMVLGLLMFLALIWGLYTCEEARADHWRQTASLMSGTYMIIYIDMPSTDYLVAEQEYLTSQGKPPYTEVEAVMIGLKFRITDPEKQPRLKELLNIKPKVHPDQKPILLKKGVDYPDKAAIQDKIGWYQIPLPCKWIEGEVM